MDVYLAGELELQPIIINTIQIQVVVVFLVSGLKTYISYSDIAVCSPRSA
jgi:hypothetical protein